MLVSLVAFVVLMPVSYRAGTGVSHPHTIFQGLIDMVTGQPHHHHGDHDQALGNAKRAGAGTELNASRMSNQGQGSAERQDPNLSSPDMPTLLGLSSPIDATASIHALGALVAAILSGSGARAIWGTVRTRSELIPALEPPPPRPS